MANLFSYANAPILLLAVVIAACAVFLTLALRKIGRSGGARTVEKVAETVRLEADRIKSSSAEQARDFRIENSGLVRGLQDSLTQKVDSAIDAFRTSVTAVSQKLDVDIGRMGQEANQNRETLRHSIEVKLDAASERFSISARELREELIGNFEKTSGVLGSTLNDLGGHQLARLEKVETALSAMSDRQAAAQEALRLAVEGKLDAIRVESSAKLDEMRQTVDEKLQTALEKRLGESFRTVSEQLERVYQGLGEMQNIASTFGDFRRMLSNVKVRGTYIEDQVGALLDEFLTADQYLKGAAVKSDTSERVEYAVKFPGPEGVLLPIDAKFPREAYERLVQASEEGDAAKVAEAASELETAVRIEARKISEKYINPPVTTDFAVMYLGTEGLYAELIRRPGLAGQLRRDFRVVVAGPTNLAAILSSFQMGFRSLAIQKRSSEVWQILGAVRAEFSEHGKVVLRLKKQLSAATNTVDDLGRRTRVMNRKLTDVEVLPGASSRELLGLDAAIAPDYAEADPDEASEDAIVGDEATV